MQSSIYCGMKGSYRVQIKDKLGNVVEDTDYFDNDITNIGLNYPYFYSFARCFMFLSLGGTKIGAQIQNYSGLPSPITDYLVFDPTYTGIPPAPYAGQTGYYHQSGQYIGWPGYELGSAKNSPTFNLLSTTCGTNFTPQGVNLFRGWTIPTGVAENGAYLAGDVNGNPFLNINGFMVSPSTGGDPTGQYAFSLVNKSITIPSGFSATITYQLSLSFPTYSNAYNIFQSYSGNSSGWFNTGNATTGTNGSEINLLSLWANASGIYRQLYPGIELVNGFGACSIPLKGNSLEPYVTVCPNLNWYLSSDMTQFAVNKYTFGGPATGEFGAYNSNGLPANYYECINYSGLAGLNYHTSDEANGFPGAPNDYYYSGAQDVSSSVNPGNAQESVYINPYENIHLDELMPISNYNTGPLLLTPNNYLTPFFVSASNFPIAYANAGTGINPQFVNYGQKVVLSSYLRELPNLTLTGGSLSNTGSLAISRTNSCNKKCLIPPILSQGTNSRYGALTLGYINGGIQPAISNNTFLPLLDFLFFDTSGRIANMPHYRYFPYLYLSNRGSGLAQVIFSVTGSDGNKPTSVNRFWQATGFMGSGYSSPSGLDPNNPLFGIQIYDTNPPTFYPHYGTNNGAPLGYALPGQILSTNVLGGTRYNQGLGWGAVYGIVASTGFYQSMIDCGLVDVPIWSGYSGFNGSGIPNHTGTPLFWPNTGVTLGLNISGVQYFLKGFTELGYGTNLDTGNLYSSGVYAMVGDFFLSGGISTATGSALDIINSTYYYINSLGWSLNNPGLSPYQAIYLSTNSGAPTARNLVSIGSLTAQENLVFTGVSGNISFGYLTGADNNNFYILTGFNYNLGIASGRGSGQYWTPNYVNSLMLSGADNNGTPYIVGSGTGLVPLYLTFYDGHNGGTFYPVTGAIDLVTMASQLCAPTGYIDHHEYISLTGYNNAVFATGNRLLPNYAMPNNSNINTYSPIKGGQFPGLSTENGMELFLNFSWNA